MPTYEIPEPAALAKVAAVKRLVVNGLDSQKSPAVLTIEQVLNAETYEPKMLVETLVPTPGVSLVVAPHKTGKTLLSLQIGMSIAANHHVCDQYRVEKSGPVLFVEHDDPGGLASIKDVLKRSKIPMAEAPFYTVTDINLTLGLDFVTWLDAQITTRELVLVVLDSYTALRGAHTRGGDLVKDEQTDLTLLDKLAKKHCIAILLIHHYSKGSVNHDWSERAAGTFAMGAATEAQIVMTRFPDLASNANERLVRVRGRHLAGSDIVLRLDPATLTFEHVLEGGAAPFYAELVQLKATFQGSSFSPQSLSVELGMARTTAHRMLGRLQAAGAIRKTGYGKYMLEVSL